MLCPSLGMAQAERGRPVREFTKDTLRNSAPTREAPPVPLSTQKLEEVLRLLLKTDSTRSVATKQATYESSGLIIDQTITKIGHDFYDAFYTGFEAPPGVMEYTVVVAERRGRGTSALVAITVNEEDLLELPLQPKQELIEEAAAQTIGAVNAYLNEKQAISRQLERGETNTNEVY